METQTVENWEAEAPDEPLVDVKLENYVIKFA